MHKMYAELAEWWPLISPPEDYADEAAFFQEVLVQSGLPSAPTLLELGSGGGSNAAQLKNSFAQVTLTDISEKMLAVSREINPDCEHLVGDMRTLRLGRAFDVVFIHDAIDYMTSEHDLRLALATASTHCKPGGLTLIVPDYVLETFEPSTDHGGGDADNGERALRYLEWTYDPGDTDTTYTTNYVYLLRNQGRELQVVHDQHICGLFPREVWLELLRETGFEPEIRRDDYGRDVFVARRAAA